MRRLLFVGILSALPVLANERTQVFKSVEDSSVPADPSVCAAAPFRVNVRLDASLWSQEIRGSDGAIVEESHRIGTAYACAQITSFTFPPGLQQNFYARFDLPDGSYTTVGTCTLISNSVPKKGVILAGCALSVTKAPEGVIGGAATSLSVFNPFKLAGFNTGSEWTLRLYTSGDGDNDGDDHDGFEVISDDRSDAEIPNVNEVSSP